MAQERPSQPAFNPIVRALAGWQPARVLMTANRLEVFDAIGRDSLGAQDVARRCQAHPRSMRLLLNACVALGFLELRDGRYANTADGLRMLIKGGEAYIGDGINHSDVLWSRWALLAESVRTNRAAPATQGPVDRRTAFRDFILAMHDRAMRTGQALADGLDLRGRRQLFDCGGGPGTYSVFLVKKNAGLRAILFDLPQTVEIAVPLLAEAGVADRVTTRAGDYFVDDFGEGNDVVLLSAVVHSMAPKQREAAPPQGVRLARQRRDRRRPGIARRRQRRDSGRRGAILAEHAGEHGRRALLQRPRDHVVAAGHRVRGAARAGPAVGWVIAGHRRQALTLSQCHAPALSMPLCVEWIREPRKGAFVGA